MADNTPVIALEFDNYPTSIDGSDVMTALGGTESYSEAANRLAYTFNAPETIQENLLAVIRKYMGEDYALKWFDDVDNAINANNPDPYSIDRYALTSPFNKAYADIEDKWLKDNEVSLSGKLAMMKSLFKTKQEDNARKDEPDADIDNMKKASDADWNDALIINMDNSSILGARWQSNRDEELLNDWHDLIDDLLLLYAAVPIYIAIRAYGEAVAYYL